MQKRVIKKRGVVFSNNAEKIPGLAILLPASASKAAKRKALEIVKKETIQRVEKNAAQRIAENEESLAKFLKGREFIIERRPHKQSKLVFTSKDGKKVQIKHITGGGKVEEIKDLQRFSYYLELALSRMS